MQVTLRESISYPRKQPTETLIPVPLGCLHSCSPRTLDIVAGIDQGNVSIFDIMYSLFSQYLMQRMFDPPPGVI